MGNNNSQIKSHVLKTNQLPTLDQASSSDEERELKLYLSNKPSDSDRQHTDHFIKKHLFQCHFSSPIEDRIAQGGCKVLDVGCGPGTWLLSLASQYKDSHFVGLDMKPLYPKEIKPDNLEFIEANIFNGLPFNDEEFDFVHMEQMVPCITRDKWDFIFSELIRITKLGGYIELAETYSTLEGIGPIFLKVCKGLASTCLKQNVDLKTTSKIDSLFDSLPNITKFHREDREFIMGPNGGKIGLVWQGSLVTFLTSKVVIENLSIELGISKEDFRNIVKKDIIEEFKNTKPVVKCTRYWTRRIQ